MRRIGRQAPVKRCLARSSFLSKRKRVNDVAELAPRLSFERRAMFRALTQIKTRGYDEILSSIRKHLPQGPHVGLAHQRQLLQLAHAPGLLGAQQMALAGVHPLDFPGGGNFKALSRAAMRLQLPFRVRRIPGHSVTSSRLFPLAHGKPCRRPIIRC
jgi:hypothetical protein